MTGVKFGDWTDKKSRKEKRRERRARERNDSKPNPEPELLFYGRNSGVAELNKSELFRPIKDDEPCTSGYDKVCERAFLILGLQLLLRLVRTVMSLDSIISLITM